MPYQSYLEISGNEKTSVKFTIESDRIIIGRLPDANDISLEPDPQKLVTRYMHCSIEQRKGIYWLIDNASKNGTFLKHEQQIQRVQGEARLLNQDIILILAEIDEKDGPQYWEIKFIDPQATEHAGLYQGKNCLEYDWIQTKLFIWYGSEKREISGLTPQEHKLIRFMDQRNKNNGNVSVMCSFDELIDAVWDENKDTRSQNDVNHLVWSLRKKVEQDPQHPKYLQSIRGMGYRLITLI